ncbi:hypothetical protein F3Y22_tig00111794pilonHSYRG00025 [Hibiscus syriacus]|uniref:DNA (Cytosine-5)-methyltransferase DRM1/2 n=1 Tax=Hibiscus syriacus TaxID=106335 RepID=A0A6A2YF38_HIBSY|nr:hypothetical protein F3Y22_tig00111794pilonHSYRG00025 [Hibiscus syriacus]
MEVSSRTEWYKSLDNSFQADTVNLVFNESYLWNILFSDYEAIFQDDFTDIDSSSDTEELMNSDSDEENKLLYLTKMGYSEAEASIAMERCSLDSSITELTDFICAAQMDKAVDALLPITQRTLSEDAIRPPYFENVALAPVVFGSAKLTERIHKDLEACDDEPPSSVQNYVLDECQKWNLVWVRRNKVVPFKPDEVEMLLGFPKSHTRGGGSARDMFPNGINILSLFSGISDAEVAFYCLGIPLKTNMQELNGDWLEQLMSGFGEFDLVISGIQFQQSSEGHNGYNLDKENDRHGKNNSDVSRPKLASRISGTSLGCAMLHQELKIVSYIVV